MVTMRHGPFPGSSVSTYAISPLLEILTGVCVAERWKARTATAIPNAAITRADVTAIAQRPPDIVGGEGRGSRFSMLDHRSGDRVASRASKRSESFIPRPPAARAGAAARASGAPVRP